MAVLLGGCDGLRDGDRTTVSRVVVQALNGTPGQRCQTAATRRFVAAVFDSAARCRLLFRVGYYEDEEDTIRILDVRGGNREARVRIRVGREGYPTATGHVIVRRDGLGDWRVDELDLDLLRSLFLDDVPGQSAADVHDRSCLRRETRRYSADEFRQLAYRLLGAHRVSKALSRCFYPRTGNLH